MEVTGYLRYQISVFQKGISDEDSRIHIIPTPLRLIEPLCGTSRRARVELTGRETPRGGEVGGGGPGFVVRGGGDDDGIVEGGEGGVEEPDVEFGPAVVIGEDDVGRG
jgi:hypothetical protein